MPPLLALEWDNREVWLSVASRRGRKIVVEHAFSIPCAAEAAASNAEEQIGRRIAEELDARGIGRPEAVVAIGRTSIELRQLQLPPSPDEDLPDLVRFQASREFNELDENWLLDFVPIDESSEGARTVLAMAIAPAVIRQIQLMCDHAGLKMRRLVLRPCEAAAYVAGDDPALRGKLVLLVDPLGAEADLTAVVDGKAVFLRTTRLGADPPPLPALLAEVRLTIAAVQNQLGGRKVELIRVCGKDPSHADLARDIEAELGLRADLFDPFAAIELAAGLQQPPPERAGHFAPLLGMLVAELNQSGHAIDFLHPRRRAEVVNPRRKWIIAGVAVGVLGLAYLIYDRVDHYLFAAAVDQMAAQSKSLDDQLAHAKKVRASTADIAKWADEEVIWLDRLYELNQGFPPAEEAMLGQLTLNAGPGGGQMDLKGWVRRSDGIARLEKDEGVRAGKTSAKSSREDRSVPPYAYSFEVSVKEKGATP